MTPKTRRYKREIRLLDLERDPRRTHRWTRPVEPCPVAAERWNRFCRTIVARIEAVRATESAERAGRVA
jgi:hypothetical protein